MINNNCRICLSYCDTNNLCNCRGTIAFVHYECIEKYYRICDKQHCEFCLTQFKIKKTIFDLIYEYFYNSLIILFMSMIISNIIFFICITIYINYNFGKLIYIFKY